MLTISLHESGRTLFPGTGSPPTSAAPVRRAPRSTSRCRRAPATRPGCGRSTPWCPPLVRAFEPEVLVTQHGCDTHSSTRWPTWRCRVDAQRDADERCTAWPTSSAAAGGWPSAAAATSSSTSCRGLDPPVGDRGAPADPARTPRCRRRGAMRERFGRPAPPRWVTGVAEAAVWYRPWEVGYDPRTPVDRAIMATRRRSSRCTASTSGSTDRATRRRTRGRGRLDTRGSKFRDSLPTASPATKSASARVVDRRREAGARRAWTDRGSTCQPERPLAEVRFLTVAEVAAIMRVSKMTVYRLVHGGELPAVRVGRSFRVPEQAVHDYLRSVLRRDRLTPARAWPGRGRSGPARAVWAPGRPESLGMRRVGVPRRIGTHPTGHECEDTHGLRHQEAPQAYGEEEAPQAAAQDASSVATRSDARRRRPPVRGGPCAPADRRAAASARTGEAVAASCWSPGCPATSAAGWPRLLTADPAIDRVIGVDVVPPRARPRRRRVRPRRHPQPDHRAR